MLQKWGINRITLDVASWPLFVSLLFAQMGRVRTATLGVCGPLGGRRRRAWRRRGGVDVLNVAKQLCLQRLVDIVLAVWTEPRVLGRAVQWGIEAAGVIRCIALMLVGSRRAATHPFTLHRRLRLSVGAAGKTKHLRGDFQREPVNLTQGGRRRGKEEREELTRRNSVVSAASRQMLTGGC